MPYCIKCGKHIPSDSEFCPYCGARIKKLTIHQYRKTVIVGALLVLITMIGISIIWDIDHDGLSTIDEVCIYGTSFLNPDTDLDGLLDGEEVHTYWTDPLNPDTDKDALPDGIEVKTLSQFGSNPRRRDVFVEIDWMEGTVLDGSKLVEVFAKAPVTNYDGSTGITLHLIFDEKLPSTHVYVDEFYRLRKRYRTYRWFYYCILARTVGKGYFGDEAGFSLGADGFAVEARRGILGAFGRGFMPVEFIFLHELGHTLGLMPDVFDGIDSYRYSYSEYPSAMNYNQPFFGLAPRLQFSSSGIFNDWSYLARGFVQPAP